MQSTLKYVRKPTNMVLLTRDYFLADWGTSLISKGFSSKPFVGLSFLGSCSFFITPYSFYIISFFISFFITFFKQCRTTFLIRITTLYKPQGLMPWNSISPWFVVVWCASMLSWSIPAIECWAQFTVRTLKALLNFAYARCSVMKNAQDSCSSSRIQTLCHRHGHGYGVKTLSQVELVIWRLLVGALLNIAIRLRCGNRCVYQPVRGVRPCWRQRRVQRRS